ncbi:MAG: hypothetical protein R6X02_31275 [Enhygromyxa sp.]
MSPGRVERSWPVAAAATSGRWLIDAPATSGSWLPPAERAR